MSRRLGWFIKLLGLLAVFGVFMIAGVANAEISSSSNYEFQDTDIGGGGLGISSSPDYQTNLSVGDTFVGSSTSSNYQLKAGPDTTADPVLSIGIISADANFGTFSPASAATATTQFSVVDYTSYGYVVQIEGTPPTYDKHTIAAMSTDAASDPGTEQFGINLVANSSPTTLGANPNNGQFGYGTAATYYNTPNEYRYSDGDVIATAPKSSGETIYTISYIVNVNDLTPGGQYTSAQSVICTATY